MKLLFDQNLSPRPAVRLADAFPGSTHVQAAGLGAASDDAVWEYARANGFAIVTKDSDFAESGVVRGSPPKVIWLQLGNRTTTEVETVLRANRSMLDDFADDPSAGTISLG